MTPVQEIRIQMTNGDLADTYIEQDATMFTARYQYIPKSAEPFLGATTLPQPTAILSFETLLHTINNIAVVRRTTISRLDNVNNDELVSAAAQRGVASRMTLAVETLVNGS